MTLADIVAKINHKLVMDVSPNGECTDEQLNRHIDHWWKSVLGEGEFSLTCAPEVEGLNEESVAELNELVMGYVNNEEYLDYPFDQYMADNGYTVIKHQ